MSKLSLNTFRLLLKKGHGHKLDMSNLSRDQQLTVALHGQSSDIATLFRHPLHHDTKFILSSSTPQWRKLQSHDLDTHTKNIVTALGERDWKKEKKALQASQARRNALVDEVYEKIHGKKP